MAIIIKEMRIRTVIEKKIISDEDISEELCLKIRNQVLSQLPTQNHKSTEPRRKKER